MDFTAVPESKPKIVAPKMVRGRMKRVTRTSVVYDQELKRLYPLSIWFYEDPPDFSISLYEFETYALDRLKLLRTIERMNMTSGIKFGEDYMNNLRRELSKQGLDHFNTLIDSSSQKDEELAAMKYDHISHYILRLAFCRTEDLRRWLITMEMSYFHLRLKKKSDATIKALIKRYKLPIEDMSYEAKNEIWGDLRNGTFNFDNAEIQNAPFYIVGFTLAMDLVKGRKVFLKDGFAHVPTTNVNNIIVSEFRRRFSESLIRTSHCTPMIEQDERLKHLLQDFDKKHTGNDYASTKDDKSLRAEMLPELSKKSFPLCMKSLYDVVTTDHHLKHWGRLQLGLFFKGIALPLDESVKYWRNNFTQKTDIDANRFDKQYLYNIRHMYGKEGKRADYTPYNCMKVIMQSVGPGESHGCPFRHSDETPMRAKLVAAGIPAIGIKEIVDLIDKTHYQIACQKYFEWTHNQATVEGGVMHPNQYFEESQRVLLGKQTTKAAVKIPTSRTMVFEDGTTQSTYDQDEKKMDSIITSSNEISELIAEDDDETDIEMIMSSMDP